MLSKIEKQLCSPDRDKKVSCVDSRVPKSFEGIFRPVNSYVCDSLGLGCDYRDNDGDCKSSFYPRGSQLQYLFDMNVKTAGQMGIRSANALHLKNGCDNSGAFGRYQTARRLDSYMTYRSIPGYNDELFFGEKGVQSILKRFSEDIGRRVKCLDLGCGEGLADEDLRQLDCVQDVLGVTLPLSKIILKNRKKILFADALCISPVSEDTKFDAVFSVYGVANYNPLNNISNFNLTHQIYGILHALKFLKEGGLLFVNNGFVSYGGKGSIHCFLSGYLKPYLPAQEYVAHPYVQSQAYQYVKRPEFDEITNILKIHEKYLLGEDPDPQNF